MESRTLAAEMIRAANEAEHKQEEQRNKLGMSQRDLF